jgi:uncharacterized protein
MDIYLKLFFGVLYLAWNVAEADVIPNGPHIYVEGYAEKKIMPDQVMIRIDISQDAPDIAAASNNVEQRSLKLFETLKAMDIPRLDVKSTPIQINPHYEYKDGVMTKTGTVVSRNIDITLKDIARYHTLNQALVDAAISQKLNAVAKVKDSRAVKQNVLMAALKDARQKAEQLAAINGKKIKDVYSISEFRTREDTSYNLQPTQAIYGQSSAEFAQMRTRVPAPPPPNGIFEMGEMTAEATVYVVYTIQ